MDEVFIKLNVSYHENRETKNFEIHINLDEIENFNDFSNKIIKKAAIKGSIRKYNLEFFYENDWIKLVDLKSFYFFVSNNIHLQKEIELRIIERNGNNQIVFDLDGTRYKNEVLDDSNRPTDKIYDRICILFLF